MMTPEPRERISLTIDAGVLREVDAVAEARGESRSALIERMLANEIEREKRFLGAMENPVTRAVLKAFTASPQLLETVAALVGDRITPEYAREISDGMEEQVVRGRERRGRKRMIRGKVADEGE